MSVDNEDDLKALSRIGRIVALAIREMRANVEPGITTGELDAIGAAELERHGARAAPRLVYGFPGVACISVNDEAAHGVPGKRVVSTGDLVSLDMTAELDGYYADACVTIGVGPLAARQQRLLAGARAAFEAALAATRTGAPLWAIGDAAERTARRHGLRIVPDLCGHGVGRTIHEPPIVPNVAGPRRGPLLTEGLVLAIEPHLTTGDGRVAIAADGWTIKTTDRHPVANFEHTIVVTTSGPLILTAARVLHN